MYHVDSLLSSDLIIETGIVGEGSGDRKAVQ